MKGHIKAHGKYFCSQDHVREYEKKHNLKTPLTKRSWFFYLFASALAIILITALQLSNSMLLFMGAFFLVFFYLKALDWKGFASAFANYDIIATKSRAYAFIYPLIELYWALSFIFLWNVTVAAWSLAIIMSIGTVGVAKNLMKKNPVSCACIGTLIKIPLTKFTLIEDISMAVMALMILFF